MRFQTQPNLWYLNLHSNIITDISSLSSVTSLQRLFLPNNNISDISALSNLTKLTKLSIFANNIDDISALSKLTNLEDLYIYNNDITNISALSGLTNLQTLDLHSNNIEDISALTDLINLTYLNLGALKIDDISALTGLNNLNYLYLSNNKISYIPSLSGLVNLKELFLHYNNISNISGLSGLNNLLELRLGHNVISDINKLSGLTNLAKLYLENNSIIDISSLSNLSNLYTLQLNDNSIIDISALAVLTNLYNLYLYHNQLNCSAYDIYIPMIKDNNPGIYITYDSRPEYCDYQPDIDVSPVIYDFGNVEYGFSSNVLITICNMGNGDLTLDSLEFTPDSSNDFTLTSAPTLPYVIVPVASVDIEVTFTPTVEGISTATLEISSDDPDEPVVQVVLIGAGGQIPPSAQIEQIIVFFDESVADGTLVGVGPGNSAANRLNAFRNMLKATGDLISGGYFEDACAQLVDILKKCDGQLPPPDFVAGEAREELVNKILKLMEDLGCVYTVESHLLFNLYRRNRNEIFGYSLSSGNIS